MQEISQSTGESMASLYDRISKGTIAVDEITASMERSTAAGGKYYQSMEKQSKTLLGQFSTLKDNGSQLIGEIASSTSSAISTELLPTINTGLNDMMTALQTNGFEGMAQVGGTLIASLVTSLVTQSNQLISMAITLITALVTGLQENATQIANGAVSIISTLVTGIISLLPSIISLGLTLLIALAQGITNELPTLIPAIVDVILQIVDTLTQPSMLAQLISTALTLILTLTQGLLNALPRLLTAVPKIIQNVVSTLIKLLPQLLPVALQLIVTLAVGLINSIPTLLTYIPQIIVAIIGAFSKQDWGQIGKDIINGLISGLKSMLTSLSSAVSNIASTISSTFKDLLGIHSPSKVFMEYGVYTDQGYAIGIDKGAKDIYKSFNNLQIPTTFEATAMPSTVGMTTTQSFNYTADVQSELGDYIAAVSAEQMKYIANALEKGISGMRMVSDGRETARFISNLGFVRG